MKLNTIQDFYEYYKSVAQKSGDYPVLQAYLTGYADGLLCAIKNFTAPNIEKENSNEQR